MSRSRSLPALLTLALTACASGPTTPASTSEATIGGTIQDWPGGTGTVRFNDGATSPQGLDLSVPVGTDGRFSLILPAPPAGLRADLSPTDPACPLTAGTPSSLRLYFAVDAMHVNVQGVSSQLLELPQDAAVPTDGYPVKNVSRAYTDTPGSAHFTIDCSGHVTTFDLDLHAGWNRMFVLFDPVTYAVKYRSVPAILTTKLVIFRPPTVPIPPAPTPAPAPTPPHP